MESKLCFSCKIVKKKSFYNEAKSRAGGFSVYCKDCTSKKNSKKYASFKLLKNCKYCKVEFSASKNQETCSLFCPSKPRKKGPDGYKDCEICGTKIPFRVTLIGRAQGKFGDKLYMGSTKTRFCSKKCRNEWSRKVLMPSLITEENSRATGIRSKLLYTGKKMPLDVRKRQSERLKGKNSHFWRGGVTNKNKVIRAGLEYRIWREAVFKRDDYTCQICKERGRSLHSDHIKPFAYFPELRFELSNGRTLCVDCHMKTDTYLKNEYNKKPPLFAL